MCLYSSSLRALYYHDIVTVQCLPRIYYLYIICNLKTNFSCTKNFETQNRGYAYNYLKDFFIYILFINYHTRTLISRMQKNIMEF